MSLSQSVIISNPYKRIVLTQQQSFLTVVNNVH